MKEIMIDLQGGAKAPLYERIYESIRREIVDGRIPKGEKLPSTRLLAKNLAVSRSTVEMAYDQLLAEGYIKAEPCRGFFVCDITELYRLGDVARPAGLEFVKDKMQSAGERKSGAEPMESGESQRREAEGVIRRTGIERWTDERGLFVIEQRKLLDFSPYLIDTAHFPYNTWRKISKKVLLDDREELLYAGDGQGEWELRRVIAEYLHQARGVNCDASNLILGAGNEYLEILLTQLIGRGRTVLMEDPGYPQAYRTFSNMGYEVRTVAAGAGGLTADRVQEADADLVYMMPSHQFPLGTVMPLGARLELLKWAAEKEERYLIEDDHDSEYRYRGKPIPSLQSIDRDGKVIYLGTFSKSIAPSLRISYMVLPPSLMERYRRQCGFYSTTVPRMQQEVLREFMSGGYFERHLNKMRGVYRSRHDFLLMELKKRCWVKKISGEYAGLHVLVEVDSVLGENEICRRAAARGVAVSGLLEYRLRGAVMAEDGRRGGGEDASDQGRSCKTVHPADEAGIAASVSGDGSGQAGRRAVLLLGYGKLAEEELRQGLEILDEIIENK